jgi:archaellum component FlaF (FlaF/FlaG flagellin family)
MHRYTSSRAILTVLLTALILVGAGCLFRAVHASSEAEAAAEAQRLYSQKVAATYNKRFGATNYFLPSNATTDNGSLWTRRSFPLRSIAGTLTPPPFNR